MNAPTETTPIRELMPDLFLRKIMDHVKAATGKSPQMPTISDVVSSERYTSKYWAYVEELAMETDPDKYTARMDYLKNLQRDFKSVA